MIEMINAHGSGNTFFLLDADQFSKEPTDEQWQALAQTLCTEKTAILGQADGILVVSPATSSHADAQMRIFNQDGSEAQMCGNGLRIVARYLIEKTGKTEQIIQTKQADLPVKQTAAFSKEVAAYQVMIAPVSFDAATIGMNIAGKTQLQEEVLAFLPSTRRFSAVAVPNPHLIAFVDEETIPVAELQSVAEKVNQPNPWFPDGINVSFVKPLGEQQLFVQTYERGVGFTNACGTAMSASSLMYVLHHGGIRDQVIEVRNPGGMVRTIVHKKEGTYWMELIGNATYTKRIQIDEADLLAGRLEQSVSRLTGEEADYQAFVQSLTKV